MVKYTTKLHSTLWRITGISFALTPMLDTLGNTPLEVTNYVVFFIAMICTIVLSVNKARKEKRSKVEALLSVFEGRNTYVDVLIECFGLFNCLYFDQKELAVMWVFLIIGSLPCMNLPTKGKKPDVSE